MSLELKSSTLEVLKQASSILYNYEIQKWKQQGGKVVGYTYSFVPEELITAAGLLPFRIRATGADGTEYADAYFTQINCTFVRYCYDMVLQGQLDFIDGVVSFNACDHIRRMYDNWNARENSPCFHFMVVPQKRGETQRDNYYKEILKFKASIEEKFDVMITEENLRDAIKIHNETRRLQRRLYEFKKQKNPPITGADTLAVIAAGFSMPKERYNQLLSKLMEELSENVGETSNPRLMLVGMELDDPQFIEILESQGATVVTDMLWYGTRSFVKDVDESNDPYMALANYYLNERPADPRIYGTSFERYDIIKEMAKEYDVDGVITAGLFLCDQIAFDQDDFSRYAKKEGIPHLRLDIEYVLGGVGQLKTRVQAFIETLEKEA